MVSLIKRLVTLFFILSLVACIKNRRQERKEYFPDGRVKSVVELQGGKRHGNCVEYYKNGQILSTCFYENDRLNGLCVFYDSTGSISMQGLYEDGFKVDRWTIYGSNKFISQNIYYNKIGRAIYFEKFKPNGDRSLDPKDSKVIILPAKDSIDFGEPFEFLIALGNKRPGTTLKFFLDSIPKDLLERSGLPKLDSVTTRSYIRTDKHGLNNLSGFVIEISNDTRDSVLVFPFNYAFFVKSKNG
jgi:hypothetical protein